MKLRSGKILKYDLPFQIEKKLNHAIEELKILLANNVDFAKELISVIAYAQSVDDRYEISNMINGTFPDIYATDLVQRHYLLNMSGTLLMLITGDASVYRNNHIQPKFHDIIQQKMLEAFDIDTFLDTDTSLSGEVDQNDNIEI